jgi:hypothetical protein
MPAGLRAGPVLSREEHRVDPQASAGPRKVCRIPPLDRSVQRWYCRISSPLHAADRDDPSAPARPRNGGRRRAVDGPTGDESSLLLGASVAMRAIIRACRSSSHYAFAAGRHCCWFAAYVATVPPIRGRGRLLRPILVAPSSGYATQCLSYFYRNPVACGHGTTERATSIPTPNGPPSKGP